MSMPQGVLPHSVCQSCDYGIDPSLLPEEAREQLPFLTGEKKINKDLRAADRGDNETPNTEGAQASQIVSFKF